MLAAIAVGMALGLFPKHYCWGLATHVLISHIAVSIQYVFYKGITLLACSNSQRSDLSQQLKAGGIPPRWEGIQCNGGRVFGAQSLEHVVEYCDSSHSTAILRGA